MKTRKIIRETASRFFSSLSLLSSLFDLQLRQLVEGFYIKKSLLKEPSHGIFCAILATYKTNLKLKET